MSGEGEAAIHGWGCTPTGEAPNASKPRFLPTVFVRGWQRTTLYMILITLMLLVFLNLALTLWIIASLRLSMVSETDSIEIYTTVQQLLILANN